MKLPKFDVIFDRKKKSDSKTPGIIEVRITLDRKTKYISTGVKILPSEWNSDATNYVKKNPLAFTYNEKIKKIINTLNNNLNMLMAKGAPVTLESVTEKPNALSNTNDSFIEFAKNEIENRTDVTESTKKNHRKLITALNSFGKIKAFGDLTTQKIREFDQWLHERKIKQTTIASYHKFLKVYVNIALTKELLEKYPYTGFKIQQGNPSQRKFLTEKELEAIIIVPLPTVLEKVRDMFLFQCYTGLAYIDMSNFKKDQVSERNGKYILTAQRIKSKEDYYIVLVPKAIEILEKYEWKLPLMTMQQYNTRLKVIAEAAGIKPISSHMARHSFAVNAINKGIPIQVVSKMLGHTKIDTTQLYAKIIDKTIEEAFETISKT